MINRIVFFVILLSLTLSAQARKFVHPGILTVNKNIERMRNQIANKEYPAYGSFVLLKIIIVLNLIISLLDHLK